MDGSFSAGQATDLSKQANHTFIQEPGHHTVLMIKPIICSLLVHSVKYKCVALHAVQIIPSLRCEYKWFVGFYPCHPWVENCHQPLVSRWMLELQLLLKLLWQSLSHNKKLIGGDENTEGLNGVSKFNKPVTMLLPCVFICNVFSYICGQECF